MLLMRVRKSYIRQLVSRLLADNDVESSPVGIELIAKNLGIDVVFDVASNDIAGFLVKDYENKTAVIGVNKNHSEPRQRFTIAHELGHFFLHDYDGVHFDGKHSGSQMFLRDEKSSQGTDVEEREANYFAAEILMPVSLLQKDLAKIKEISLTDEDINLTKLAKNYKVSSQALTFRLANLGYINL